MALKDLPLHRKLQLILLLTTGVAVMMTGLAVSLSNTWHLKYETEQRLATLAQATAYNVQAALAFNDNREALAGLKALRADPGILGACITDASGNAFATIALHTGSHIPCKGTPKPFRWLGDDVLIIQPIYLDSDRVGMLYLAADIRSVRHGFMISLGLISFLGLIVMSLAFILGLRLTRPISQPLKTLAMVAEQVSMSKNYAIRVPVAGEGEVRHLIATFNDMLTQIESRDVELKQHRERLEELVVLRTNELQSSNGQLRKTIEELTRTQGQLIESEKLSALGHLVAGIAHELNTPIGNALTIASTVVESDTTFRDHMEKGVKRSELQDWLAFQSEALELLMRSLERATTLIGSFKQMAADEVSGQRRSFQLEKTLKEIVISLEPVYKRGGITINLGIGDDAEMDSFPGAIGQIMTNLFENAKRHAFEGVIHPSISISESATDSEVVIVFEDNGIGISHENISHVFEPFFTTKMGCGGTGLGLSICYNLVRTTLGGQIKIESEPGQGTRVIIRLPRHAPASGTSKLPEAANAEGSRT